MRTDAKAEAEHDGGSSKVSEDSRGCSRLKERLRSRETTSIGVKSSLWKALLQAIGVASYLNGLDLLIAKLIVCSQY